MIIVCLIKYTYIYIMNPIKKDGRSNNSGRPKKPGMKVVPITIYKPENEIHSMGGKDNVRILLSGYFEKMKVLPKTNQHA